MGIILGFSGYRHDVLPLMQVVSHKTRAFIWNEDGQKGFLTKFYIMPVLYETEKAGKLEKLTKW